MKNLEEMQNEALIRIVDDDADLRKGLTFMLECAGWKSAAYPSARDFLTQDSPSIPGCLILDVQMAGMTGIELQHEMNRRGNTLPIIFLTGHGDIDMAVTAMIDGAANFIQKPPESGKLLAAIETCVSQSLKNVEGTGICQDTSKKLVRSLFIPEEPQQGLCPYASLPQDIFLT